MRFYILLNEGLDKTPLINFQINGHLDKLTTPQRNFQKSLNCVFGCFASF